MITETTFNTAQQNKGQTQKSPQNNGSNNKQWINNKTTALEQTAAEATRGLNLILLAKSYLSMGFVIR